jgi:hypothetical protein
MNVIRLTRGALLALLLCCFTTTVSTQPQPAAKDYAPEVGQSGKDVVWVPTPQTLVDKMLDMARMTTSDFVIDLGSGDGRTVITAAKRGARAHGIEYNPDMVELSRRAAAKEGVSARATFAKADLFQSDFSKATVITMFLLPEINLKLRPKILELKPGTRVVSNSFTMGEWEADQTVTASEGCTAYCTAYLWIVPAKVEGSWRLPQGELKLKQTFQMLSGTLRTGNGTAKIANGKMNGDQINFTVGGAHYTGRVTAGGMDGTIKSGDGTRAWHATRDGKV